MGEQCSAAGSNIGWVNLSRASAVPFVTDVNRGSAKTFLLGCCILQLSRLVDLHAHTHAVVSARILCADHLKSIGCKACSIVMTTVRSRVRQAARRRLCNHSPPSGRLTSRLRLLSDPPSLQILLLLVLWFVVVVFPCEAPSARELVERLVLHGCCRCTSSPDARFGVPPLLIPLEVLQFFFGGGRWCLSSGARRVENGAGFADAGQKGVP